MLGGGLFGHFFNLDFNMKWEAGAKKIHSHFKKLIAYSTVKTLFKHKSSEIFFMLEVDTKHILPQRITINLIQFLFELM